LFSKALEKVEHCEVKSGNARNVILNYNDIVYYVSGVNVQVQEGAEKMKAIFHAKRASDNETQDLDIEINQRIYDVLLEYAKLDKLDLIMVLQIQGANSKWCIMSEDWLKNQMHPPSNSGYIV
jgi:hypothetical protein